MSIPETATEDSARQQDKIKLLKIQLEVTKEENRKLIPTAEKLRQEVEDTSLNEVYFKDNDVKVFHYTGLSMWELLQKIFDYIKQDLKKHSALSPFQQLLVTLRLNLMGKILGIDSKCMNQPSAEH